MTAPVSSSPASLRFAAALLALAALFACRREAPPAPVNPAARPAPAATPAAAENTTVITWEDEVAAWKQNRFNRLSRDDGWLTLAGFAWLEEGANSVGSDSGSAVRLPAGKTAARVGTLERRGERVTFTAAPGVEVTSGGAAVTELVLVDDSAGEPTLLTTGPVTFFAIRRADRLAVRIRDREAAALKAFRGMDYYPLDRSWRIDGRFEPASEVKELPIPNILGFDEMIPSPGHVVFSVDGVEHRLLALDDTGDGRLFLVFGDPTNGKETYGGGRFLYADPPADGKVVIDFNRAYNPPCVFTPFATCPLPPPGNRLSFPIRAGEKKYAYEAPHPETNAGA